MRYFLVLEDPGRGLLTSLEDLSNIGVCRCVGIKKVESKTRSLPVEPG